MISRLRSELAYAAGLLRVVRATQIATKRPAHTLGDHLAEWAAQYGKRPALSNDRESYSYRDLDARANAYARWANARGLKKGDAVALLMPNRPEYVAIWFGLARAGIGVALVNTNLTGTSLAHSLAVVSAKAAIVDAALAAAFASAEAAAPAYFYGEGPKGEPRLDLEIAAFSDEPLAAEERPALTLADPALYIYTSGTTGMPKAARITHSRALRIMLGFAAAIGARPSDRVYMCLPMYHTNGGSSLSGSRSASAARPISARNSRRPLSGATAIAEKCTLFVYIGELCRYLMNNPVRPEERQHKIRACVGNGLQARHLRGVSEAFRHSRGAGVLRLDRRQCGDGQFRLPARRHRPHSRLGRHALSR